MLRPRLLLGLVCATACAGGGPAVITATLPPPNAPPPPEPPPAPKAASAPAKKAVTNDPDVPTGVDAARDGELARKVEPIVRAFTDTDGVPTPDGKRLLFVSNRDGVPQLYLGDATKPAAAPARIVSTSERVALVAVTPDGKSAVFSSDHDADENFSLYRIDLATLQIVELTPGEALVRDSLVVPRGAATVYFSAHKTDDVKSTIYAVPVAGGDAKAVYAADDAARVVDATPDGKSFAVLHQPATADHRLEVVDAASGKADKVYPPKDHARIFGAVLAADGKSVYVATDGGGEAGLVVHVEVKGGKELARWTEKSAASQVTGCVAPRKRDRLACTVLAGDHAELRLLDAALKSLSEVKLPLGSGRATAFADDGKYFVAAWSTPSAPTELFFVDGKSGAVAPARSEPRPQLDDLATVGIKTDEFAAEDGTKIPVHVYLPSSATPGTKVPVIVNFHGGPNGVATIGWSVPARFFTGLGYAWVEPNIRGSGGYGRKFEQADDGPSRLASFGDLDATLRWVGSQPWADADRVVALGADYGGYLVLVALTRTPGAWRAGVDLAGMVNWQTLMKTTTAPLRESYRTEVGDPDADAPLLAKLTPLNDANRISAPLFVYAGANDPRVPRTEADQIVMALRQRGARVEYFVAANEGHSLAHRENQVAVWARAARFIEKALERAPTKNR